MNQIKVQIQTDSPNHLLKQLFGREAVSIGDEAELQNDITIVNMSDGAESIAESEFLLFVVEHADSIAAGLAANTVYDLTRPCGRI